MFARTGLPLVLISFIALPLYADPPAESPIELPVVTLASPIERVDAKPADDKVIPVTEIAAPEALPVTDVLKGACTPTGSAHRAPRLWVNGEVLCWWLPDGPLKAPLVTVGDPADGVFAGALGQAGTRVLFGGNDINYGRTPGFRLTLGGWAGDEPFGFEASLLWLDTRDVSFAATSNALPALFLPIANVLTGNEGLVTVGNPATGFAGNVAIQSHSRFWGWEANGLIAVTRGAVDFNLIGGFRYADLKESIVIVNNSTDLLLPTQASMIDQFEAANRFYGGQVGGRVTFNSGCWSFGVTGKVAAGCVWEDVNISGRTVQNAQPPVPAGTFGGAVFTQSSNIGRHSSNEFATLSELNLRLGCQLCGCLRATVGYDLLYWDRVVRPGDQIDRAVNVSQSPVFATGSLVGAARPAPLHSQNDFFVQGFTAGLELRY
jgi:Putative beta barrel porin-7 (BBP7)